jgi:hypothetical protein
VQLSQLVTPKAAINNIFVSFDFFTSVTWNVEWVPELRRLAGLGVLAVLLQECVVVLAAMGR